MSSRLEKVATGKEKKWVSSIPIAIFLAICFVSLMFFGPIPQVRIFICEKVFGPDSLPTAYECDLWGQDLCMQAKYREAVPLFERSLKIKEKYLGDNSRSLMFTKGRLASVYYIEDKRAQAESLRAGKIDFANGFTNWNLEVGLRSIIGNLLELFCVVLGVNLMIIGLRRRAANRPGAMKWLLIGVAILVCGLDIPGVINWLLAFAIQNCQLENWLSTNPEWTNLITRLACSLFN